jgi:hypothetical protein
MIIAQQSILLITYMNKSSTVNVFTGTSSNNFATLFIVIALILVLRLYRGMKGRVYRHSRVFRTPILYSLILVFFVLYVEYSHPLFLLTFLFIPVGFILGTRFDFKPKFFYYNKMLYYKRSPIVLIIWLVSFMTRLALEFFYPTNFLANLSIDSLLALTTGVIISEAQSLLKGKKEFTKEYPQPDGVAGDQ